MAENNNQMPNGNPWPPSFVDYNSAPIDPASNFLQTFINIQQQQQQPQPPHNHQLIHPHQLHQRQIHQQPYFYSERIPTTFPPVQQLPSLPPPPVTTTSILTQMPSEGNHFTFAGFGNEFNNRNISTPRPVPRNAATNRWNDNGSAFTELTPGLASILANFQSISFGGSQEATAPSIRGQSSLGLPCVGRNYLGRSAALMPPVEPSRNPFRLSALPSPSPYARPRTRRFPTTAANKRDVTPAANNLNFMTAFLDANSTLPPPPPIAPFIPDQTPDLNSLLVNFEKLSCGASQEANAPSIRGQPPHASLGQNTLGAPSFETLVAMGRNYLAQSGAHFPPNEQRFNPFRLPPLPPVSLAPFPNRPSLRYPSKSKLSATTTSNKLIEKRTVAPSTQKTFAQAFLEANPNLLLPEITPMVSTGVHFVPRPEPFQTPGACPIQQIQKNVVPEKIEEEKVDENEEDEEIDVEN